MTCLGEEGSGSRNNQCQGPEVLVCLEAWRGWHHSTANLTSPAHGPCIPNWAGASFTHTHGKESLGLAQTGVSLPW